jgi:hypothetical protein
MGRKTDTVVAHYTVKWALKHMQERKSIAETGVMLSPAEDRLAGKGFVAIPDTRDTEK